MPVAQAEELKRIHGNAVVTNVPLGSEVEIANPHPQMLSRRRMAEILEPRADELLKYVKKSLRDGGVLDALAPLCADRRRIEAGWNAGHYREPVTGTGTQPGSLSAYRICPANCSSQLFSSDWHEFCIRNACDKTPRRIKTTLRFQMREVFTAAIEYYATGSSQEENHLWNRRREKLWRCAFSTRRKRARSPHCGHRRRWRRRHAVNRMIQARMTGVEFICANTDVQALRVSQAPSSFNSVVRLTSGLGAGSNPDWDSAPP